MKIKASEVVHIHQDLMEHNPFILLNWQNKVNDVYTLNS